jgi:acid phosphatase (class A)
MRDMMRKTTCRRAIAVVVMSCALRLGAQDSPSAAKPQPYALPFQPLALQAILPTPPQPHTKASDDDLAFMHKLEQKRTPAQVERARDDDTHEEMFLYADVLGSGFTADRFPATARLSARLRRTSGSVDNPLKQAFQRIRPYNFDPTLHPVCETNQEFSYPSGHAVNGYVYAYALAEMLPAYRDRLLARADAYAFNRVLCGVHYTEDVEASRRVAQAIFGALFADGDFQKDMEASRHELAKDH